MELRNLRRAWLPCRPSILGHELLDERVCFGGAALERVPDFGEVGDLPLVPAKAGTQTTKHEQSALDARLRGHERSEKS